MKGLLVFVKFSDFAKALPGYPLIRLWPESVEMLYGKLDALPLLTPTWDKRYLLLTGNGGRFHAQPLPLAAIYLLDERRDEPSAPRIEHLPTAEALVTLITHAYSNRLMDKDMRASQFTWLQSLLRHIPVRRVHPHADPARLPQLCQTILDDFAEYG